LSLITVHNKLHILGIHDFAELSDQRHVSKIFDSLQCLVETQMSVSLSK